MKNKVSLASAKEDQDASKPKKKKVKQIAEAPIDEVTSESVKESIRKEKETMYIYPTPDMSALDKKKFRSNNRRELASRIKKIGKEQNPEEKAKLIRQAQKWAKKIYTSNEQPSFE